MESANPWAVERIAAAALFAGLIAWSYTHWISDRDLGWPISLVLSIQLAVIVVVPAVAAGLFTAFRPSRREWTPAGLAAALAIALVFGYRGYDGATYDNNAEFVLSATAYTFVTTFAAGSALVLAAFVASRWQLLTARNT